MNNYKWCICDMDGTLLNSKNAISKEDESALKAIQQKGLKVMLASGRVDLMLKPYISQLELKGYVISCNGALIRDIETNEIIYSRTMDKKAVNKIITYCLGNQIDFFAYAADLVYSNKDNLRALKYENMNQHLLKDLQFTIKYMDDRTLKELEEIDILKVLLICKNQEQVEFLQSEFTGNTDFTVVSSASGLLDIMASGTSKGKALGYLAEKLNTNLEEVIAFGDNYNDIDMLESVGMPIAMENSVQDLKTIAKHITKSNDESGVAYAINNLI